MQCCRYSQSNGFSFQMAADNEISLLTRGSLLSKATRKTWSSQPAEEEEEDGDEVQEQPRVHFPPPEGGIPSPELKCFESEPSSLSEVAAETKPSEATRTRLSLSFDTSQTSLRSTDTTLEFFDAPLAVVQEGGEAHAEEDDEVVTMKTKVLREEEELEEEKPSLITDQTPVQTLEDLERKEEEEEEEVEIVSEIRESEEVMETVHCEETEVDEVQPENEEQQHDESSSRHDTVDLEHDEILSHNEGN